MGTNFYLMGKGKQEGPHIGKRSAAGAYCWDCDITLCKDGNEAIHSEHSSFYDKCPLCGKKYKNEGWKSTGGRELGFNKTPPKRKTGVASCSSFNWAMAPTKLLLKPPKQVLDEYGRVYSWKQFQKVLEECPVHFYSSIGVDFS